VKLSLKHIPLALAATCFLVFTSCGEDFLDLAPNEALPVDGAITNTAGLEAAVIGVYSQIQNSSYYGRYMLLLPDVMSDDVKQNASANRAAEFAQYNAASFDFIPTDMWEEIYQVVNNANTVINANLEVGGAERDALVGEALTARALAHFDLVRLYGQTYNFTSGATHAGVPIILVFDQNNEPTRNTVAEVYAQVESDLEAAIGFLDNDGPNTRFSQAAAQGILARVKLYQNKWSEAEAMASAAISSGFATLTPSENYVSTWSNKEVPGALMQVVFNETDNNGSDALGGMYIETGYGDYLPAEDLTDLIPEGDVRGELFASDSVNLGGEFGFIRVSKFSDTQGENALPIIRLAEVYLIRAEARARLGSDPEAQEDVTLIRRRGLPSADVVTATGDDLIAEILMEKRIELAFEGHRLFELTRLGQGVMRGDCTAPVCEIPYPSDRFILPIPQAELDANPNIQQNPGF